METFFLAYFLKYKRIIFIIGGLLILAILFFSALIVTDPGDNIVVTESKFGIHDSGERFVTGSIQNMTENAYSDVSVEIDFLNSRGEVVETASTTTPILEAGETWQFEAPVKDKNVVKFEIKVISPDNLRPEWLGGCATMVCWGNGK